MQLEISRVNLQILLSPVLLQVLSHQTENTKESTEQISMHAPNKGLPSDADWSSAISEPGFEFLITETLLLPDLHFLKSQTLTKSILCAKPKPKSLLFKPENEAGTVPVAISTKYYTYLHISKTQIQRQHN